MCEIASEVVATVTIIGPSQGGVHYAALCAYNVYSWKCAQFDFVWQCSGNPKGVSAHSRFHFKGNFTVHSWMPPSLTRPVYFR